MNNYYPVCHHTILCHECTCPNRFLKGYDLWRWMMFHSTMGKKNRRVFFDGKIFLIYYIKVFIFCLARLLWINISQFLGSLYYILLLHLLWNSFKLWIEYELLMFRSKYCFPRLLLHTYIPYDDHLNSHRYVQQIVAPGWGKINQEKQEETEGKK